MQVTNKAPGARTFQVKGEGKDAPPVTVTLEPGESRDLDLAVPDHPVLKAWEDSGEVTFGSKAKADDKKA